MEPKEISRMTKHSKVKQRNEISARNPSGNANEIKQTKVALEKVAK